MNHKGEVAYDPIPSNESDSEGSTSYPMILQRNHVFERRVKWLIGLLFSLILVTNIVWALIYTRVERQVLSGSETKQVQVGESCKY